MIKSSHFLAIISIFFGLASCSEPPPPPPPMDLTESVLIPKPVSLQATGSSFSFSDETMILVDDAGTDLTKAGEYLAEELRPATGFGFNVEALGGNDTTGHIFLVLAPDPELGTEGYDLHITEKVLKISSPEPAGLIRGVQTLKQLLPPAIEADTKQEGPWRIATGTIRDYPVYSHRGAMLDVSRHFFSVDDVKRFIDLIAAYKMNVLHLHLSDDQGWRIEIKSWPNLTKHGGSTEVGGGEGGYYTQEEYRELVDYAGTRHITIIPEIDMPGHTNAALASYPELNCDGKARDLYTGMEVGFSTLCTDKEITYKFVDEVIGELVSMTPGPYIHIGGDESHVTKKEDYVYFINRVQTIVHEHGKQMIGWDEITEADLKGNSIAQYWADAENAKRAVEQNVRLIMSPARKAYLDMQYDSTSPLGLHWAGYIEVDSGYIWDPAKLENGISREHILGIEAPLWTETITNMDELEYMVFPRLPGYAEIGWTPAEKRNWDDYRQRLGQQMRRFEFMGIDYYPSRLVPWDGSPTDPSKELEN